MKPGPDAGLLPGPEPAAGGTAGAAELRRDVHPVCAGGQDESDDPDDDLVPGPGPAFLGSDRLLWGQVAFVRRLLVVSQAARSFRPLACVLRSDNTDAFSGSARPVR